MQATKTDNHYLADKVALRARRSPWPEGRPLSVLDCFGGMGRVWSAVEAKAGRSVDRLSVDQRIDLDAFHIHGDNRKVLAGLDLDRFDVVDLDAYGIPCDQLEIVLNSGYKGVVFVTAIQTMHGVMPSVISRELGFPDAVREKAPSLLARRGWELLKDWLAVNAVDRIHHRSKNRKHYFCFSLSCAEEPGEDCGTRKANTSASPS